MFAKTVLRSVALFSHVLVVFAILAQVPDAGLQLRHDFGHGHPQWHHNLRGKEVLPLEIARRVELRDGYCDGQLEPELFLTLEAWCGCGCGVRMWWVWG